MTLDIDRFKSINDGHGHAAGDLVIRAVADACRSQLGPAECLGRLGGEEFAILLPDTPVEDATACAERIPRGRPRIALGAGLPLCLTISIGVSRDLGTAGGCEDLSARADAGLYRAKHGGRDRVIVIADGEAAEAREASRAA